MLMRTSILEELERPFFEFTYSPESNDFLGEDMLLCQKMSKAGYTVKIDTVISHELRHLGTFAFGPDLLD